MDLAAVIQQLRDHARPFEGRVAGAADYATGVADQTWMTFPAAYVVPEDEEAAENRAGPSGTLEQDVTERFGVIVGFDNQVDRRGQSVTVLYDSIRAALFRALLNWRPPEPDGDVRRAARGLYYVEGALQGFDRARLFYKWTFALDILITDADGWQEPLGDLEAIEITVKEPADTAPVRAVHEVGA